MQTKFTLYGKILSRLAVMVLLIGETVIAQDLTPWTNGNYGHEWIDYSKKYVRISLPEDGVYRLPVSLISSYIPVDDPSKFQLWHRGKEVALISANATEIVFYGKKNDGASDGMLFRPGPEDKPNGYFSLFSDNGSYILTNSATGKRVVNIDGTAWSGNPEPYHFQKNIKTFTNQFSFGTLTAAPIPLNNSFYEKSNSWVSNTLKGPGSTSNNNLDNEFQFVNWVSDASDKPSIEASLIGMHYGTHALSFSVGKTTDDSEHTSVLSSMLFSGIDARKLVINNIPSSSINSSGGVFRVKSVSPNSETNDWTALAYYFITYPQLTDMAVGNEAYFNFKSSALPVHLGITNAPAGVMVYDISDIYSANAISGNLVAGTYHASVPRSSSKELNLIALKPSDIKNIDAGQINPIALQPAYAYPAVSNANAAVNASDYDFLIITATPFLEEANNYAKYRNSSAGGSYRTAVFEIKSLYAQFNYGEPSPIAIKRFAHYMVKDGIRPKHNILLIGNSVTTPDGTVVRLKKEMPDEIPTMGDPGSDNLLVSGIHGLDKDIPAIPIGRIPALSAPGSGVADPSKVANYLDKVKAYENTTSDKSWRKNVMHLVGAKSGELEWFTSYLDALIPIARTLDSEKSIQTLTTPESSTDAYPANITTQVNNGIGMITYYGHGSWNQTQLNIGNITKPNNTLGSSNIDFNYFSNQGGTYNADNNEKYPFMYFNGCGVGNAFSGRNPTYIALASDWLLAPKRGAIAIVASSFNSYATPTKDYLVDLYTEIFTKTDAQRKTIGMIKDDIARKIVNGTSGARIMAVEPYAAANIHQANLFGDPALRILNSSNEPALPVEFAEVKAILGSSGIVQINWKTTWEKDNSYFVVEKSSDARNFVALGRVEGKGTISDVVSYLYFDNKPFIGVNYYRIKQVDKGGESVGFSYSRVVSVKNGDGLNMEEIQVYPNPASSVITVNFNSDAKIKSWTFINTTGAVVKKGLGDDISMEGLQTGEYIINVITYTGESFKKKIVKR